MKEIRYFKILKGDSHLKEYVWRYIKGTKFFKLLTNLNDFKNDKDAFTIMDQDEINLKYLISFTKCYQEISRKEAFESLKQFKCPKIPKEPKWKGIWKD
jgi:hypothetical protein